MSDPQDTMHRSSYIRPTAVESGTREWRILLQTIMEEAVKVPGESISDRTVLSLYTRPTFTTQWRM